jgi:hypothetical protein
MKFLCAAHFFSLLLPLTPYPQLDLSHRLPPPRFRIVTACKAITVIPCHFSTYEQCRTTASGTLNGCGINPRYAFAPAKRGDVRIRYP